MEKILYVIEEVIRTQPAKECRKNVFETIGILAKNNPNRLSYLFKRIKDICDKYHVDFYEEIKWNDTNSVLKSIEEETK